MWKGGGTRLRQGYGVAGRLRRAEDGSQISSSSSSGGSPIAKLAPNPGWSSTAVQDRTDTNGLIFYTVINGEGKTFTQTAMIGEDRSVNSAMRSQKVDISEQRIEKISAQSWSLALVKTETRDEIALRVWEDFNPHEVCRRISSFAFSQSTNFVSPDATLASRTRSSSSCQAGDSTASGLAERLAQMVSMVSSFSSTLISLSGRVGIGMTESYHSAGKDR